jgi:hypothetical protein
VTSAIRSYEQICDINASRHGLENVINASTELMALHGLSHFAEGVLTQINHLLGINAEGFICARQNPLSNDEQVNDLHVVAATKAFSDLLDQPIAAIRNTNALDIIRQSLTEGQSIYGSDATVLRFNNPARKDFTLYLEKGLRLNEMNKRLLEVFCSNVSVGWITSC